MLDCDEVVLDSRTGRLSEAARSEVDVGDWRAPAFCSIDIGWDTTNESKSVFRVLTGECESMHIGSSSISAHRANPFLSRFLATTYVHTRLLS